MALQTREQHIKRGKATSNICTAQALLAVMASMYVVYHGPNGLKEIAETIESKTSTLKQTLNENGFEVLNSNQFDTISFKVSSLEKLKNYLESKEINIGYINNYATISLDETTSFSELKYLINVLVKFKNPKKNIEFKIVDSRSTFLRRSSNILKQSIFNSYHSVTEMMRYIKKLEYKDLSLVHAMISLGSCTMKLNAATEMEPVTWPKFVTFIHLHQLIKQKDTNKCVKNSQGPK